MRAARAAGRRAMVVFDLDNTIFDTRPRTLAAARDFDSLGKSDWFARLDLAGVRRDGRETAVAAGVPAPVVESFAAHWDDFFWRPANLVLDEPIASTVCWAHLARAAGVEVRYLTGRIESLHAASVAALRRIGLHADPDDVTCKPDLSVPTAPWKREILDRWRAEAVVGWFMTEGHRDIASVQLALPDIPCVLLECSFEETRESQIAAGTPMLARVF